MTQIEAVTEDLSDLKGSEKPHADRQLVALRAALGAVREAQERLGA